MLTSLPAFGAALSLLLLLPGDAAAQPETAVVIDRAARLQARSIIGRPAHGPDGNPMATVVDLFLAADGEIRGVVIEAGGLFGIGARRYEVPRSLVEIGDTISLRYDEGQLASYQAGPGGARLAVAPQASAQEAEPGGGRRRAWRISELLGDMVRLSDTQRFGIVHDAVFDEAYRVKAIVIAPERPGYGGLIELPFRGYGDGFYPSDPYVAPPYSMAELTDAGARRIQPGSGRPEAVAAGAVSSMASAPP